MIQVVGPHQRFGKIIVEGEEAPTHFMPGLVLHGSIHRSRAVQEPVTSEYMFRAVGGGARFFCTVPSNVDGSRQHCLVATETDDDHIIHPPTLHVRSSLTLPPSLSLPGRWKHVLLLLLLSVRAPRDSGIRAIASSIAATKPVATAFLSFGSSIEEGRTGEGEKGRTEERAKLAATHHFFLPPRLFNFHPPWPACRVRVRRVGRRSQDRL